MKLVTQNSFQSPFVRKRRFRSGTPLGVLMVELPGQPHDGPCNEPRVTVAPVGKWG